MIIQMCPVLIPAILVLFSLLPRKLANGSVGTFRRLVTIALGLQLLFSLACFAWLQIQLSIDLTAGKLKVTEQFTHSLIHYDGVSGLMFLLVSFIGLVVSRFSVRYLDGDPEQGQYFRWLGFTLGAVSLLVINGNLIIFFASWLMTSFGLHQLLMHFRHRPWARRAARTKFAISRVGDVFLLSALVLVYREFGTYSLAEILEIAKTVTEPGWQLTLASWFLVLGAATKSAQFPVHFWLPETMEAPTPVSAFMHAGIVNAGGYLLVRWSPVVVHAPGALATLAFIGGFTAIFAGLVMMTQSNIKRALGYSTVAQMGFMMLQCGLGAFSAAMLHIIAHSLYKAHAFLRTGDAWRLEQTPAPSASNSINDSSVGLGTSWNQAVLGFSMLIAGSGVVLVANLFGLDLSGKAGGVILASIICIALGSWLAQAWPTSWQTITKTLMTALLLIASYFGLYSITYDITHTQVPDVAGNALLGWVGVALVTAFLVLAILQTILLRSNNGRWLKILYVHVANGFYVDTIIRRLLGLPLTRTPSAS